MGKFIANPPEARSLMEAARSFGNYDLATAIADLIDNSIAAKATRISVSCLWNDGAPEIRVADDGRGMDELTLRRAMRPASANPADARDVDDLGRFGLGLKTASLSQCRCFTVISIFDGCVSAARWDLDCLDGWLMEVLTVDEIAGITQLPKESHSGTEVIWTRLDRLTEGGDLTANMFNEQIDYARTRLALTFHRFIDPEPGKKKLHLVFNGIEIKAFNPFHEKHPATQELETETIIVGSGGRVTITPFILPHYSKMSADEYESLAGEEGYLRNQGFYVYRNRRLIMHGTWFRLIRHGDLSRLARIRVDIPNSLDEEWKITVDKSDAQIPSVLRARLKALLDRIRDKSVRVYQNRGGRIDADTFTSVWKRLARRGAITYTINREHPVVRQFAESLTSEAQARLFQVLQLAEQNFPVETLFADVSDNPGALAQVAAEPDDLRRITGDFIMRFLGHGGSQDDLVAILRHTEPFRSNWNIVNDELIKAGAQECSI